MNTNVLTQETRTERVQMSYQAAFGRSTRQSGLKQVAWITWTIVIGTTLLWLLTAWQEARAMGARNVQTIVDFIVRNAIEVQPKDEQVVSEVLITYGAKYYDRIVLGEYWRFVTPVFLHLNALHVGLNMLNLVFLGVYVEKLAGPVRLLLLYLLTGVISTIASFYFAPHELSIGASGAIFGLVGAYASFIVVHRRALRRGGGIDIPWLIAVVAINLGLGFVIPNIDNYAHIAGLLSGCLLGWWFMPFYRRDATGKLYDKHSMSHRWPLVLLAVFGTLLLALLAIYLNGAKS